MMTSIPKEFRACWSNDFCNPGTRLLSEDFFSVELSYSIDEVAAIRGLEVGETWQSHDYGSAHTVTRTV